MRLGFVDNAKAIAILLVLLGHTDGIPDLLKGFIYSFHMPAFFFLSGLLLKNSKLSTTPADYVGTQVRTLIVPYFFFALLSLCYSFLNATVKKSEFDLYSKILGILYGPADGLVNTVLWFFTCLFFTSTIYFFLAKITTGVRLLLVTFAISFAAWFFYDVRMTRAPWNVDLALACLFYFAFGKYFSDLKFEPYLFSPMPIRIAILAIGIPALVYLASINGKIDMAYMAFSNPLIFVLNACLGIILLLLFSSLLPVTKAALFLSKNTIVIFPLHSIFFSVFTGVAMVLFGLPHSFHHNLPWSFAYVAGAILLCIPATWFLSAYMPFFIGRKQASHAIT